MQSLTEVTVWVMTYKDQYDTVLIDVSGDPEEAKKNLSHSVIHNRNQWEHSSGGSFILRMPGAGHYDLRPHKVQVQVGSN